MADNFAVWKQHFINQAKGLIPHQEKFYKVASDNRRGGNGITSGEIKMITPTQEVVQRAKTQSPLPPAIYDPLSGVMTHSAGRPRSVRKYGKKKKTTKRTSRGKTKKRKIHTKKRKVQKKRVKKKSKQNIKKRKK